MIAVLALKAGGTDYVTALRGAAAQLALPIAVLTVVVAADLRRPPAPNRIARR